MSKSRVALLAGRGGFGGPDRVQAAVQFAAERVVGSHEKGVGAADGEGDIGGRGGVDHLLRVSPEDAAMLVVLGEDAGVAVSSMASCARVA